MPWSLIGQERVKEALGRIIRSGRFPHALLLSGPGQGGKFTLAKDLAKALNCGSPGEDSSPCQDCLSCRKIEEGNHPDFLVCRPSGAGQVISIADVRELRQSLGYRPYEGRRRVVVIKEADSFQEAGGGSLLKTLEEPGPSTVLILTAISESRVMETLVSRCVRLRVPPLAKATILAALREKAGLDGPRAELVAGLSAGALGAALAMDAEAAWASWGRLDRLLGQALEPKPSAFKAASDWSAETAEEMDALRKRDAEEARKADGGQAAGGLRRAYFEGLAACLRLWWRDAMVLAATGEPGRLAGPPPTPAMRKWAARLRGERMGPYFRAVDDLEDGFRRQIRPELALARYWLGLLAPGAKA